LGLTLVLIISLTVIVTDHHYQLEYPTAALTFCICVLSVSELIKYFDLLPPAYANKVGFVSSLLKPFIVFLLLTPSIQSLSHPSPASSLYDFSWYGPSRPCRNGHTRAGVYHSDAHRFARLVGGELNRSGVAAYDDQPGRSVMADTGDSRTLLPFAMINVAPLPFTRRWLNVTDGELVALDCHVPSGPSEADLRSSDVYLVLHGLSGGSDEAYVKDFVGEAGAVSCVMVARGMMRTPVLSGKPFHGARTDDVHISAKRLRKVMDETGMSGKLIGVGFSMGGIVLSNYVARSGKDCALDAAVAVGAGIDMRFNRYFQRSLWLWQPFLSRSLLDQFFYRFLPLYKKLLTPEEIEKTRKATSVTEVDINMVAPFNGFASVDEYYTAMSPASDFKSVEDPGMMGDVSIPFAILSALDDPIVCEKCLGDPSQISQVANGNIFYMLSKRGGHVGFPIDPIWKTKWSWMNGAILGFINAVASAEAQMKNDDGTVTSQGTLEPGEGITKMSDEL